MGSELLKMADGFAMVVEILREMAGQVVEEAETEQDSKAEKSTAGVKVDKKKEEKKVSVEDIRAVLAEIRK